LLSCDLCKRKINQEKDVYQRITLPLKVDAKGFLRNWSEPLDVCTWCLIRMSKAIGVLQDERDDLLKEKEEEKDIVDSETVSEVQEK